MSGWIYQLAQMLAIIYEALRDELRVCGYLQADETPVWDAYFVTPFAPFPRKNEVTSPQLT